MATILRRGTGKRRAVNESATVPSASQGASSVPVAFGVIALGILSFVMAYGFATHPDSNESTKVMFSSVFTLLGLVLIFVGIEWRRRLTRKK